MNKEMPEDKGNSGFPWDLLLRRARQRKRTGRRTRGGAGRSSHPLGLTLREEEAADKERPEDKRRMREILASLRTYS